VAATIQLDTQFQVGAIDRRIFSGFAEHLGRCVYEGIYDPGSPRADERGFRKDVIAALAPLGMPLMRYPGGNFVSCYNWKDGVGPKEKRPARTDYAWHSVETNQFGTDEFMAWCKAARTAPMMAVNLGTGNLNDVMHLVEYCNLDTPTYWADQRRANGQARPYGVKTWCLGNEMDGPWQAGQVPAEVYAQRAKAAGRLMKGMDRTIETVACGSSGRWMGTYLEYDRTVLEYGWNEIDYISAHRYSNNDANDSAAFLAEGLEIDRILEDYAGLIRYVRGKLKSDKQVHLSFDEWNVWYRDRSEDGRWQAAPHLLEEAYNVEDALVCAQYLSAFVRRADLVKIACIAQIVNVIAPIMTKRDGLLLQTIYHPFRMIAEAARGVSLTPVIHGPLYKAGKRGDAPALDAAVSYDEGQAEIAIFLTHRDGTAPLETTVALADKPFGGVRSVEILTHKDPYAANTWEAPHAVMPVKGTATVVDGHTLRVTCPPKSFTTVRVAVA